MRPAWLWEALRARPPARGRAWRASCRLVGSGSVVIFARRRGLDCLHGLRLGLPLLGGGTGLAGGAVAGLGCQLQPDLQASEVVLKLLKPLILLKLLVDCQADTTLHQQVHLQEISNVDVRTEGLPQVFWRACVCPLTENNLRDRLVQLRRDPSGMPSSFAWRTALVSSSTGISDTAVASEQPCISETISKAVSCFAFPTIHFCKADAVSIDPAMSAKGPSKEDSTP